MEAWNSAKSAELYGINSWGDGYFGINAAGNVVVCPERDNQEIDLNELLNSLRARGVNPPLLLRFDGILRDRVRRFDSAFGAAIKDFGYKGRYHPIYPIKVNQMAHVVDTLRQAGKHVQLGLEVGSKPELVAVMALHDTEGALLLCNGYKDDEYIELALMARKLGRRVIVIIEQQYEIQQLLKTAKLLGVEPEIGFRMKPSTKGSGHWEASSGDKAKFGLTSHEILQVIEILKSNEKQHWLKLLHFHIGSQIPSIFSIKRVLREASRMYTQIARLCPTLSFFDAGGGLGIDYDGTRTNSDASTNYTLEEYARDIVSSIQQACDEEQIPHPTIVTESGRALTAHHAILVTEAISSTRNKGGFVNGIEAPPSSHPVLKELFSLYKDLSIKNCHETLNDARVLKDDILERFNQGDLTLEERAYASRTLWSILRRIKGLVKNLRYVPEDFDNLSEELREIYFCNFSVFQSLPDSWAINQLFPIMPLHRLSEEPTCEASIADVSCDNDGRIDRFISLREESKFIRLHDLRHNQPYYLAVFLVGAYQEVLGDLHNLFGDTHAVHVDLKRHSSDKPRIELTHLISGDSVKNVLGYLEYDASELLERMRILCERCVEKDLMEHQQAAAFQARFRQALEHYTYLDL
ncbi:MAG: biosynthetic arginine decarboxylase [Bdellovibrionales bacterium]|nr:biosynthetic arginine decarboxylase [Bdellovibrionales bacterium]